jgi:DHA2 family multidrug resistance protein-like MFS transporter
MEQQPLSAARRTAAMVAICLTTGMVVLDTAIANIALPTITAALHAAPTDSVWVVSAYLLAVTGLLLPAAALGDSIGLRRVFIPGLLAFMVASLGCALATSLPWLIAARALQGVGGAAGISLNMALVRMVYPRELLGRGIGYVTLMVALATAAGPTVAALLLGIASWPWLFAINVPIGIVAFVIALRSIPDRRGSGAALDWTSTGLNILTFTLLIFFVDNLGGNEAATRLPLLGVAFAVVAGTYLYRSARQGTPMFPLDLLRRPIFALSAMTSICSYAAQGLAYVGLPFLFIVGGGRDALTAGLLITPWPAVLILVAPLAGRLSDRYPAGLLGGLGLLAMSAGLLALFWVSPEAAYWNIAWRMVLAGIGFGFFQSPNNRAMALAAPPTRAGAASGMVSTARLLGQSLGAALLALCFAVSPSVGSGARKALALGAAIAAAGMVTSFTRLRTSG